MEVTLQLAVFLLLVPDSLAAWTRVTVMKGDTPTLRCPISNGHGTNMEWKNPEGFIMFFNTSKVLKDKRYGIKPSQYTINISNISFKDAGNYTCTCYDQPTMERKVEVTVIGHPRISVTRHKGKISLKCSAQASFSPPLLSWKIDHGAEFSIAPTLFLQKKKKHVSESKLNLLSPQRRVTVHCLVHHPALYSQPLTDFVRVGHNTQRSGPAVSSSSPTARPPSSSRGQRLGGGTRPPPPHSSTLHSDLPSTLMHHPTPSSESPPDLQHLSTRGWSSASEVTEHISLDNRTTVNNTGSSSSDVQKGVRRNSKLLVLLVASLIVGLLVIVLFLAIKLRKAHAAWRKENEESDPSEESSKSKSSQEEKNDFVQRRKGLSNTIFTQYIVQEPTVIVPEVKRAAQTVTDSGDQGHIPHGEEVAKPTTRSDIKETSL